MQRLLSNWSKSIIQKTLFSQRIGPNQLYKSFATDLKLEKMKKRILYQSKERGLLENNLLLGTFVEKHLATLDEEKLAQYDKLLQQTDLDIFAWISGNKTCPPELDNQIMQMLRKHVRENPLNYKLQL